MIVYLDIETTANSAMRQYVTVSADEAPANYKKAESIASWVEQEQQKRLDRMALDVDYARIVAISWAIDDEDVKTFVMLGTEEKHDQLEACMLRKFWQSFADRVGVRFCGYNLLGFDLHIVLRRSWVLGVPVQDIDMRRYSSEGVIDLMELLYGWGSAPGPRSRGLKAVCQMYGIPNPIPGLDGSQVADMDAETLAAYCANDVRMTRELAQKMRGYYWR
jgi:hypothetical protein